MLGLLDKTREAKNIFLHFPHPTIYNEDFDNLL